jgi:peptide/nickel transport system substrate-binding protein
MPAHQLRDADPAALAAHPLARAPVGTGRFRFVRWTDDGRVELVADTVNFRGRPALDRVIYETMPEIGPALVRLLAGETDFVAPLLAQSLADVAAAPDVRAVAYPSLRYQLLSFNLRRPDDRRAPHPVLGDARVRRALTMATNTDRLVRAVFDTIGRPALGPIPRRALPDPAALRPLPFDTLAAQALLDSAGWIRGADGRRARGGVPLRLEVLVPGTSENRQRMAVLLQDQWKAVGATLVVQRLDVGALLERLDAGRFDAVTNGWALSPGLVGLRQVWRTDATGNNFGRYANATVDAMVDSLLGTFDAERRAALTTRVAQAMIDDAPAIWLVEDAVLAGVHTRLDTGSPSPLGWWHDLPAWSVRPGRQIARDRLGLAPSP